MTRKRENGFFTRPSFLFPVNFNQFNEPVYSGIHGAFRIRTGIAVVRIHHENRYSPFTVKGFLEIQKTCTARPATLVGMQDDTIQIKFFNQIVKVGNPFVKIKRKGDNNMIPCNLTQRFLQGSFGFLSCRKRIGIRIRIEIIKTFLVKLNLDFIFN